MKTLLLLLFSTPLLAQTLSYPQLSNYKKIGWMTNAVLFDKGHSDVVLGTANPEHFRIVSYGYGLNYHLHADKRWSFSSGIWVIKEAAYNLQITFDKNDVTNNGEYFFTENTKEKFKGYAINTFSFPLLAHYQLPVYKNGFIHSTIGLKAKYFLYGSTELTYTVLDKNRFGIYAESPKNTWQGSLLVGGGTSWARKKYLLRADVLYTHNFQNTLEGFFKYGNLLVTPDSEGTYTFSGNHWSLMLSVHLPSKKSKENLADYNIGQKNLRPKKYQRLGLMLSPVLYNKATSTLTFGTAIPKHLATLSYAIGLNYDVISKEKWVISSGLWVSLEPSFNSQIDFNKQDFSSESEEAGLNGKKYTLFQQHSHCLSLPVLVRYQLPLSQNSIFHPILGLKAKLMPYTESESGLGTPDYFYYRMLEKTPKNPIQGSVILGAGFSLKRKKHLLRTEVIYNINTQNNSEGRYELRNLLVTPDSEGNYTRSGNYLGLLVSVHLPSKKESNIK